jgi:hypothetical protein
MEHIISQLFTVFAIGWLVCVIMLTLIIPNFIKSYSMKTKYENIFGYSFVILGILILITGCIFIGVKLTLL